MQELDPWFRQLDIINMYLRDVEGLTWPGDISILSPKSMATAFVQMGFSASAVCSPGFLKSAYYSGKDKLDTALRLVKTHTPERIYLNLPLGTTQTIIRVRGPITREFTVLNQMLPVQFLHEKERYLGNGKACIIARIEFFNDKIRRKRLITRTWSRLRLLDPSLLP
jgi:hypothetical protein